MSHLVSIRSSLLLPICLLAALPGAGCTGEGGSPLDSVGGDGPAVNLPPEAVVPADASVPPGAFQVTFTNDPAGYYAAYYPAIRENVIAAGEAWARQIRTARDYSIAIAVVFAALNDANASGTSSNASEVGQVDGLRLYHQGVAYEMVTGEDPNGAEYDATITFDSDALVHILWFASDPAHNADQLPGNKIDGYSTCLHEMAHIIAFNGWRGGDNRLPAGADYQSVFDALLVYSGGHRYFTGAAATALYGGWLPLTDGDYDHLGNPEPGPGSDLVGDILHGPTWGLRRHISTYDVAMLQDMGIPTR